MKVDYKMSVIYIYLCIYIYLYIYICDPQVTIFLFVHYFCFPVSFSSKYGIILYDRWLVKTALETEEGGGWGEGGWSLETREEEEEEEEEEEANQFHFSTRESWRMRWSSSSSALRRCSSRCKSRAERAKASARATASSELPSLVKKHTNYKPRHNITLPPS